MTVLTLVFGAAILLTLMLVHSYSREGAHTVRTRRARRVDGGGAGWMFSGDGSAGDCSAGDAGGGCGDGGGGD